MRTTKQLLIGLAVLAVSVTGIQAQEERIWERHRLDYKDSGLKRLELTHGIYKAEILNLQNCNLGELILPVGLLDLRNLNLRGNNNLTNLVFQMDTSIDSQQLHVAFGNRENMKISLPSWMISTNRSLDGTYLKYPILKVDLEGFKEVEIRPNGVELIKASKTIPFYKDAWILVWGYGQLQRSSDLKNWRDEDDLGPGRPMWNRGKRRNYFYEPDPWIITFSSTKPNWYGEWSSFFRIKPPELPVSDIPTLRTKEGN